MKFIYIIPLLVQLLAVHSTHAATLPGIPEFITEMVAKHQFKRNELEDVFAHAQHLPTVVEATSRPATNKPWLEYRSAFVNAERIKFGLQFWDKYRHALRSAEQKFGVPQEIILAVIGVETVYGRDVGTFRTLDALTTLAFDYPRRATFFRSELENFLLLARDQQFNLLAIRGSYAGALGIPQFMPSSYRKYAVDFNNNHSIDLLREPRDAIGSVANYLRGYGWNTDTASNILPHSGGTQRQPLIAVPVQVGEKSVAEQDVATHTLAAWSAAGVVAGGNTAPSADILVTHPNETARLINFTVAEGKEYWLVFHNFDVITRYNNSDFYAMSVFQLAQALKTARREQRSK